MEAAIAQLLYSLPDVAVVVTDKRRRIESYSPGLLELVGTGVPGRLSELFAAIRLCYEDADGEHPVEQSQRPTALAHRGRLVKDMVLVAYCPDGTRRYLRFNAAPRRSPRGTVLGAITLVQDVTVEHLRARLDLALRDLLVDAVNHGLRTPLTLVVGHAELLADMNLDLPREAQDSMDTLVGGARRLSQLVSRVSELVDLASAGQLQVATVDLAGQIRDELAMMTGLVRRRHVQLCAEIPPTVIASIDARLLKRAVGELIRNAAEYAPRDSVVRVRVVDRSDLVVITVDDEGPGILEADADRLCRPFESGPHAGPASSGRGLGLALVRAVATAHGGTLELETVGHAGLRATLRLPRDGHLGVATPDRSAMADFG